MPTDGPLVLAGRTPLFSGSTRDCYAHPDDPDLIVKVPREGRYPADMRARKKEWRKRRLPLWHYDVSLREWKAFRRLGRRIGPALAEHIAPVIGMVRTDRGPGQVARLVRSADGSPATPLPDVLARGHDPQVTEAVRALLAFLRDNAVPVSDLSPPNIVLERAADGTVRAWLVDGFGGVEFVPLTRVIRPLARRRARKAIIKFHRKIDALGLTEALALRPSRA